MKQAIILINPIVRVNHEIILGLCDELGTNEEWDLRVLHSDLPLENIKAFITDLQPNIIFIRNPCSELVSHFEKLAIPFIVIGVAGSGANRASVVQADCALIGEMAANYLLDLNFQHFAVVDHTLAQESVRSAAFTRALKLKKRTVERYELPLHRRPDQPFGHYEEIPQFIDWLKRLPKPCAIFAHSDQPGAHIVRCCIHHGIPVPEDISVVGVDDDLLFCNTISPNLASVHVPYRRIGIEAARMLKDWRPGRRVEHIAPTSVVARESCRPPLRSDPLVDEALKYLRKEVRQGVRVSELQKLTGLTPNQLVYRFHNATGHSPMEMILQQRIHLAKRLLVDTSQAIGQVAQESGFTSATQFYVIFKQRVGTTPSGYRKQFRK
jgi:LacI family transcriptional regulator